MLTDHVGECVADDWLEDCLDNVNVPGALHVIMTSPGAQHKTQPCRKGQC